MKKRQIALIILIILGVFFYLYFKQGTLPYNKTDKSNKIFVIGRGESLQSIVNNLEKADLIRSKLIFYLIVRQMGIEKSLQAGDFRLSPSMDAYELANNLTHGTLDVWVTLIEGTRKEEMAHIISRELDIPEVEFIQNAEEGYLFPDTYLIPKDATAGSIISILQNNFENKFTSELKESAANKNGLSEKEVLTLASIVEKEAKNEQDKYQVANVLVKRLNSGMRLQVDATIQYALGYQSSEKSWWKNALTFEDLKIDSPYNTYTNDGLPPSPICNPGLISIQAVAEADGDTPYFFYISDKNGVMRYARNLEEHNENIRKYLR